MNAMKWMAAAATLLASAAAFGQGKIVLGHTGIADYAAAYIAQEEGFFKKHGVEVEFQQVFGPALAPGLQSGSMHVTTMTPASFLLAVDGGLKLVAVANTTASVKADKHYALVAKTGSNISSVKELVGKKVGVPGLGLTLHIMAKKSLMDQGVDTTKVDFIEVPFAQLNDVLRGGGVDAIATAEPFLGRTVQAKVGNVIENFFEKLPEGTSPVFYVSSQDWVAKNKDSLNRFRLALADATQFAEANPEKVRPIIGKFVKVPADVLAAQPLPRLSPQIQEPQVVFWINTLSQQSMLKTKLQAADIVSK